ncbi:MAG: transposase [Rhodospirillaceae bacterium]|nr:transposase [Rhodospirillaceae bacterium]
MAVGKRPAGRQDELFVATSEIRRLSHPFYQALERMLKNEGFDAFAEATCREFYAEKNGRPGIPPGVYFRMLLIGYLEGIGSERGIAWRCADSISLRDFLGYGLSKNPPDHSSVSRTRRRLSLEAHEAVFGWVLERLRSSGLLSGKTLGVDATTLEANAALRSIVRRDDGTGYEDWLNELAQASGIETPTRAEMAKLDRKRPKKGSNDDWTHPGDPGARITKMKDGRTHLAHKLEQASDMDSGAVVAVTVQTMDGGDCASMPVTLDEAGRQLSALEIEPREAVADKGYHSNATMKRLKAGGLRSYVSEPDRGRRNWKRDPDAKELTYANRRRVRGARGKRLLRRRGEILERAFAHLLETGGLRRVHVRGQENIRKRMLVHAAAFNLGLLMRSRFGYGTPRAMQGHAIAQAELAKRAARGAIRPVIRLIIRFLGIFPPKTGRLSKLRTNKYTGAHLRSPFRWYEPLGSKASFATGC